VSLQSYLNENDVINSIRLQLRHSSGVNKFWVIVEGESDQKLFSKLINGENVVIEISHGGVTSLLKTVASILQESDHILGIRDADFIHLERNLATPPHIFLTDFHDAEMMLVSCNPVLNAIFREYLPQENNTDLLRTKILQSIAFIGSLRWINELECLELNFKNLGLAEYYDVRNFCLRKEMYLETIIKRSPRKKREVTCEEVLGKVANITDFLNLCNGHDFLNVFSIYVNANSKKGTKSEEISRAFRVSYRLEDFKQTRLFTA